MTAERENAATLLVAARTDADSFAAIYRLFERDVLRFFMRSTGRPELAADLTAETFARALEGVESYEPQLGRADQWLFGIARNVLGSSYRRGRVEADARARLDMPALHLGDHESETIERLTSERHGALASLASLPDEQRLAVEARVIQERDYAEIAGELSCSQALVRKRVSRGLEQLRAQMGGDA